MEYSNYLGNLRGMALFADIYASSNQVEYVTSS